ncbi:DUF5677 domain-containing protein [Bacillus mycoides]|uniref:Uncharacterized protein n=1 Tax=Bacillus mycoides TaxID=1405 RepID=C2XU43_BACMY|nr:DUF5677 domain-containing protein [Bacillus mycoides]EEL70760.1 hypothetical protein bcere0026_22140 [Bacillus mycoides]
MKPYDVLNETIKFATKQLDVFKELSKFKKAEDANDVSTMVITALYRKIIELSEGVRVSGVNGLRGSAELNYRGLVEAYLSFKFIIDDEALLENRAKAYKIGYHKQQIQSVEQAKNKEELPPGKEMYFNQVIKYHKEAIEIEEMKDVLAKYNILHEKDKRGYLPKWHALYEGVNSFNALAKKLVDEDMQEDLMADLYSNMSVQAHNYMTLNSLFKEGDNLSIKPVRARFNINKDEYMFVGTRGLLLSSIVDFTKLKHTDYEKQLIAFLEHIKPYLNLERK